MKEQEMQPEGRKWARVGCLGLVGLLGLFVLIGEFAPTGQTPPAKSAAAKPAAAAPEFIQLKGENIYVMIIPAGVDPARLKTWAKDRCGEVEFCKVLGWTDRASAARALPMTDAELEAQAFSYGVNRFTGYERSLFDCTKFPQPDKANCL